MEIKIRIKGRGTIEQVITDLRNIATHIELTAKVEPESFDGAEWDEPALMAGINIRREIYLKSIDQHMYDGDKNELFIGGKNVTTLDNAFMAQLSEEDHDLIWATWKYDVWGDPEYDFTKSK